MTQRILERKLRILKSELLMIQNYYDESKELLIEYEREWLQDFTYFQQRFSSDTSQDVDKEEQDIPSSRSFTIAEPQEIDNDPEELLNSVQKSSAPDWAKKVFRKIAMITHPDRSSNPEKDSKLFLKMSNSFDSGDYEALVATAIDLGISLDMGTPALGAMLKKKIKSLKKDVSKLETSVPWLWGESFGIYSVRVPLLKINLARGGVTVSDDELQVAIQERESNDSPR